jgi:hypothetical protein
MFHAISVWQAVIMVESQTMAQFAEESGGGEFIDAVIEETAALNPHLWRAEEGEQSGLLESLAATPEPTDGSSVCSAAQESFQRFDGTMYLALLGKAAIPAIYTTVRIHYLGDLPTNTGAI